MSLVAQTVDHVVGIDTHARTHTYCLLHGARVVTLALVPEFRCYA
jgi:hypothetical protein